MHRGVVGWFPAWFVLLVAGGAAPAQCVTGWQAGISPPAGATPYGVLASTMWDPDGPGPQPAALVVVGAFSFVGSVACNGVAVQDPTTGTWSGLGGGANNEVHAVIAMPNGDLVIGGRFSVAGGQPALEVARWNGSTWSAMSTLPVPFDTVRAFALLPNGDLVAAGGPSGAARFATWNGASWTYLGPFLNGQVEALLVRPGGALVAAGQFNVPAGPTLHVAEWNGSAWTPVGGDVPTYVRALATAANGDLLAGGLGLRRWNGATWSVVGDMTQTVNALAVTGSGDIVVGGRFTTFAGISSGSIVQSAGAGWSSLAGGFGYTSGLADVRSLTVLPNGALVAGGFFTSAGGVPCLNLAQWNGAAWSKLTPPAFDSTVLAGVTLPNGDTVVGGAFTGTPGGPAAGIARWDGASWQPLGSGLAAAGNPGLVSALAATANGDVVAGGSFTTAGGLPALNVARWHGSAWSPLGAGRNGQVTALAVAGNGDVLAGGSFPDGIARWSGSTWLPFGAGNGPVRALSVAANGDVVAGGAFSVLGGVLTGNVARWNGSVWSAVGGIGNAGDVYALAWMPNGDLVAGGYFAAVGAVPIHLVKRWNGATWSPILGLQGTLNALVALPNGDLIAAGVLNLSSGSSPSRAFRWNGSVWTPIGGTDGAILMLVADAAGVPWAGGYFQNMGAVPSMHLAHLGTSCPATSAPLGGGCPSSGGSNTLVATRPPWVDGTFVATATGLPQDAAIVAVTSFTSLLPGFPLDSVFSTAAPGCDLHVFPDILGTLVTSTGAVQSSLFLPNVPPLVGLTCYHQLVPFDVLGAITTTNALQLTCGSL